MASIYKITSPSHPGKCYIGSTTRTLKYRLQEHYYVKGKYKCTSSQLLDQNDAVIELLELCPIENRKVREQFHIDCNECINKRHAYITSERKKELQKILDKKWSMRRVICMLCDKEYSIQCRNRHFKSFHTEK